MKKEKKKANFDEYRITKDMNNLLAKNEGIIIGKNLGIRIGREQEKIDIVKNMLDRHFSITEISLITNLTKSEILMISKRY